MHNKDPFGYKRRLKKKSRRPLEITVLCVFIVLLGLGNIVHTYYTGYDGIYTLYPAVNALMIIFSFVSISGIWSMEKWGAISFPFVLILKIIIDLYSNPSNPFNLWYLLLFPLSFYFFRYFNLMRKSE